MGSSGNVPVHVVETITKKSKDRSEFIVVEYAIWVRWKNGEVKEWWGGEEGVREWTDGRNIVGTGGEGGGIGNISIFFLFFNRYLKFYKLLQIS